MLLFGVIALGLLFATSRYFFGSYMHPACLFTGLWFAFLLIILLAGEAFTPISYTTVLIYLCGALCFTIGSATVRRANATLARPISRMRTVAATRRIVSIGIWLLLALFPLYWKTLTAIAGSSTDPRFFAAVRAGMIEKQSEAFGAFKYLLPAAMLLSLIATATDDGSRRSRVRTVTMICITLAYYACTGSRLGALTTLFGVTAIGCLRAQRFPLKKLLLSCCLLLLLFAAPAILLNKGGDSAWGVRDNLYGVANSLRTYAVSGLISFDHVVQHRTAFIPDSRYALRPIYRVAQAFDDSVSPPEAILPETQVPEITNVYSLYFPYYVSFGWFGTFLFMSVNGAFLAWLYEGARAGSHQALVLYGLGVASIAISGNSDGLLSGASFWIQAAAFVQAVFWLSRTAPALLRRTHRESNAVSLSAIASRSDIKYQGTLPC